MILKHREWEFDIELDGVKILIIENPKLFRTVLSDLNNQILGFDGGFMLFNHLEEVKFNKEIVLVNSPFLESVNERKLLNKLYLEIKEDILEGEYERYREIEASIITFLEEIIFNNNIDLELTDSIEIQDLLKIAKVKFREGLNIIDIIEKIIQHAIIIQEFLNPQALIYTNIRGMFLESEWQNFIKEIILHNINLLIIENKPNYVPIKEEKVYIIDKDYCEIY